MRNINTAAITGNLTADPDLRTSEGGVTICKMRVAVNEQIRRGEEWVDHTNFFTVTVFGNQGQSCADYLAKGRPVAVEGRLHYHEWEGDDGGKRSAVEIISNHVQFLGSAPNRARSNGGEGASDPAARAAARGGASPNGVAGDDLPF